MVKPTKVARNRAAMRRACYKMVVELDTKVLGGYAQLLPGLAPSLETLRTWTIEGKQVALKVLGDLRRQKDKDANMEAQNANSVSDDTCAETAKQASMFTCFGKLPIELRLSIWEFTFLPDTQPRVHCISDVNELPCCQAHERASKYQPRFLSNQPISVIRWVCKESRTCHASKTQTNFAFGTFVNFDMDTIYYHHKEPSRNEWIRFLEYEDTPQIKNLAMHSYIFIDLPTDVEEDPIILHTEMLRCMPSWRKLHVVFSDNRSLEKTREDISLEFRDLAGREKRKNEAPSKVRKYIAYLRERQKLTGRKDPRPIDWHYAAIKKWEELDS